MNSGSVRTACGSALTTSGGTDSRMNSGRVRRASGFFTPLVGVASWSCSLPESECPANCSTNACRCVTKGSVAGGPAISEVH